MKLYPARLTFADLKRKDPRFGQQKHTRTIVQSRESEFVQRVPMYERGDEND